MARLFIVMVRGGERVRVRGEFLSPRRDESSRDAILFSVRYGVGVREGGRGEGRRGSRQKRVGRKE